MQISFETGFPYLGGTYLIDLIPGKANQSSDIDKVFLEYICLRS